MARLDNAANTFVLNDYFEVDSINPNKGTITFPFTNLSKGEHTLSLKVWNIFNFSSDATINFVVNSSEEGNVMKLKNYPNPFSDNTQIILQHNQPSTIQRAELQIFNQDGRLITNIDTEVRNGDNPDERIGEYHPVYDLPVLFSVNFSERIRLVIRRPGLTGHLLYRRKSHF